MRMLVRGSMALASVMFVVSCTGLLKRKGADEQEEAVDAAIEASVESEIADASPSPEPAALASNEGDVARFPDETQLDVQATLLRSYSVREAPPAGAVILSLSKGTTVSQIAQRDRSFLILFDDPSAPGTKLMGWIHRDAFSNVVPDAGPLVCPKGEISLIGDTSFCGKLCSEDKDCPTGQACKGQANKVLPNGKAGDVVAVCSVFHAHDAGPAPSVVDAGKVTVQDAGKATVADAGSVPIVDAGKAPALVVDAGPTVKLDAGKPAPAPPVPGPASDVVAPTAGKCPESFLLVQKTGKCHRPCPGGPTAQQCKNARPLCIKCDKDEKKVCAEAQDQCR